MAYDFSLSGIQQAQKEVEQIGGNFHKTAAKVHSTYESIRKKQLDEINVCNAQITELNGEIGQAQQAIDENARTKSAAEAKISRLEEELRKLISELANAKKTLSSLKNQYAACREPPSSGDADTDRANRQAYQQKKAYLQNQISSKQAEIADLEKRIEEIKREIERLKQIIAKVNQNYPQLAKIYEERNATKKAVQTHRSKLKETKSNLFEKHDAFNTYYGYAQNTMNNIYRHVKEVLFNATMAVNALNRLGSIGCDRVEMDDGALREAIRELEAYVCKLRENIKVLMRSKNAFTSKLKDKISQRVKEEMECIDRIVCEIDLNIENIMRTLSEAQSYLTNYSSWAQGH